MFAIPIIQGIAAGAAGAMASVNHPKYFENNGEHYNYNDDEEQINSNNELLFSGQPDYCYMAKKNDDISDIQQDFKDLKEISDKVTPTQEYQNSLRLADI